MIFNKEEEVAQNKTEEVEQTVPEESMLEEVASSNSTNSTVGPGEVIGWDGWKILMANMNLGFELPERNTDPNFVPVPPRVSISSISVKGEVKITFSKPVFTFDNLKSRRIGEVNRMLEEQNDTDESVAE